MRLITLPQQHPLEIELLKKALRFPHMWVHVRKPKATFMEMLTYLLQFSEKERQRIVLHQQQQVSLVMGINNLHVPTPLRQAGSYPQENTEGLTMSTSTHSWDEFNALSNHFQFAFISPLFPSISKKGYGHKQQIDSRVERKNRHTEAIALGGIDATKLTYLKDKGFADYALCGAIWHSPNPIDELTKCYEIIHSSSQ